MAEDAHRGFGEALRQVREGAGVQISDLAATTRVSARYIVALEAEDWEVVPGSVIGRGFVRVLARELRQDPGPLLEAYRASRGDGEATLDHSMPESDWDVALRSDGRRWPLVVGVVVVLLLAALAGFWLLRPAPVEVTDSAVLPSPPAPQVAESAPAELPATPSPPPTPEAPPSAAVAPTVVVAGPHHLGIQAVEKVWVRVEADGGKPVDSLLQPGEKVEFVGERELRVKLGSAGSVRLTWDGAALRVPGGAGEVKTLEFPAAAAALRP